MSKGRAWRRDLPDSPAIRPLQLASRLASCRHLASPARRPPPCIHASRQVGRSYRRSLLGQGGGRVDHKLVGGCIKRGRRLHLDSIVACGGAETAALKTRDVATRGEARHS